MATRTGPARHAASHRATTRKRQALKLGAGIAVAVAASVGLLSATHTSLKTTASLQTSGEISRARDAYSGNLCFREEFERAVPKGVEVYAGDGFGIPEQILLEAATLWANPVPDKSAARWIASIQPGNGCSGYVIRAHRVS
jgi:hypothetical protein